VTVTPARGAGWLARLWEGGPVVLALAVPALVRLAGEVMPRGMGLPLAGR
jgi:hypothetical protein